MVDCLFQYMVCGGASLARLIWPSVNVNGAEQVLVNWQSRKRQRPEQGAKRAKGRWVGADAAALKLSDSALTSGDLISPAATRPKVLPHTAERSVGRFLTYAMLVNDRDDDTCWDDLCACGQASSWIYRGMDIVRASEARDEEEHGRRKCEQCLQAGICRKDTLPQGQRCLHCRNCGAGIGIDQLCFTPPQVMVCKACATWYAGQWRRRGFRAMWSARSRLDYVIGMIQASGLWWTEDGLSLRMATRMARCFISLFETSFKADHSGVVAWGWLWMQVGAVISSLDIAMKGDCGPGTCSGITGMPGYGLDVLQIEVDRDWWWRQCYWSEQAVQVPKGFASERKQAGIDLTGVVVYPPPIRATDPKSTFDLLWVEVMEIDDCTSEADSVSGNSIQGDNEDKTCQIDHGCPFDASEDAFLEGDQGRPLFTCDGCNRGFHAECVEERNAAAEFAWDVPARDTAFVKYGDWLCGDCVDEGGVLISTILDSACTNTSEAVWIVRQTGDEGRISCILNRELAKSAGQSQLLEDYRIRLRARAAAHQDIHGKLVDEVQAGLEGPRIKADGPELRIHRWGGRALAPSLPHFAQAEKTSEDQYGIWRLRTLLKRPTLIWAPKPPWQRSSKAARPMEPMEQLR